MPSPCRRASFAAVVYCRRGRRSSHAAPFAGSRSEADRLPNGNTLITFPQRGEKLVEVNPDGEIVWEMKMSTKSLPWYHYGLYMAKRRLPY